MQYVSILEQTLWAFWLYVFRVSCPNKGSRYQRILIFIDENRMESSIVYSIFPNNDVLFENHRGFPFYICNARKDSFPRQTWNVGFS